MLVCSSSRTVLGATITSAASTAASSAPEPTVTSGTSSGASAAGLRAGLVSRSVAETVGWAAGLVVAGLTDCAPTRAGLAGSSEAAYKKEGRAAGQGPWNGPKATGNSRLHKRMRAPAVQQDKAAHPLLAPPTLTAQASHCLKKRVAACPNTGSALILKRKEV